MRLYVEDPHTQKKVYIKPRARTRRELEKIVGSRSFEANDRKYSVDEVKADFFDNTISGATLGIILGTLGGVPGIVIGGLAGALLANATTNTDKEQAEIFNGS